MDITPREKLIWADLRWERKIEGPDGSWIDITTFTEGPSEKDVNSSNVLMTDEDRDRAKKQLSMARYLGGSS